MKRWLILFLLLILPVSILATDYPEPESPYSDNLGVLVGVGMGKLEKFNVRTAFVVDLSDHWVGQANLGTNNSMEFETGIGFAYFWTDRIYTRYDWLPTGNSSSSMEWNSHQIGAGYYWSPFGIDAGYLSGTKAFMVHVFIYWGL